MVASLFALLGACSRQKPAERHYYDEQIQPVFNSFCVGNTSPCHRVDPSTGTALGNLDLSSFDAVHKRPDVLRNYGSYPQPLLLLKALPEETVLIPYAGQLYQSEIRHVGGKTLDPTSDAFIALKNWLSNGATRDGLPVVPAGKVGEDGCSGTPATWPAVPVDRTSAAYQKFVSDVAPVLRQTCTYSNCHSSPQADFYLTCGDTPEQTDSNFLRATNFVARAGDPVEQSELLLRPLSPLAGGLSHTGGSFFAGREDATWKTLLAFATMVQAAPPAAPTLSTGETFFTQNVMPLFLRRGCALEGCHSPDGFNDFRLRPGSVGFLADVAVHRNYESALTEFMSLDTPDVRQSRIVKKNLLHADGGITHRAGSLLVSPGSDPKTACPTPFDAMTASPFCTLAEWHRLERIDHADLVSPLTMGSTVPLAFVSRPADGDSLLEFDTFRGGADLKLADAQVGASGRIESVANVRSALTGCAGLSGRTDLDVRGPAFSPDGARLAFAARAGQASGLDLWLLDLTAKTCRPLTTDNGRMAGLVRVHNFDPVFAPDGSLVFASTRRGTLTLKRFLPNADLFRVGANLDFGNPEAMTALSNSELSPAFMQNGQLTFTAEKASPDFYQLSGRRMNWDLTDYHPLLAQRSQSDDTFGNVGTSIGYQQATEIQEGLDRNFLLILSDATAKGAGGALAIFNRSVGPFEQGRQDSDKTFLPSMHLVDPAATGRAGTRGVYRSPSSLPNGEILASYAGDVGDPSNATPRYDLVAVSDDDVGTRRVLLAGGAQSLVEATVGIKHASRLLFRNRAQLVFGGSGGSDDSATVHFPDLPMLATLLNANLRRGRNVAAFDGARYLAVYSVTPPPAAMPDPSTLMGPEMVFTQRTLLGTAPLESDGSIKVTLPARQALVLELQDGSHKPIFTMREEHQLGPGESISPGVSRTLFDGVCGGCHGSVTGKEPDIAVTPDALTGATVSISRLAPAKTLR